MSLENSKNREPSPCRSDEGCQGALSNRQQAHHHTGGVGGGGMSRRESRVSREVSASGPLLTRWPTTSTSRSPGKAGRAGGEVGDAHSSDDPRERTTRGERRGGTCPDAIPSSEGCEDGGMMPIITSLKVRKLQRTLYQQAKGNARWRAWSKRPRGELPPLLDGEQDPESRMRENCLSGSMRGRELRFPPYSTPFTTFFDTSEPQVDTGQSACRIET